MKRIIAFILALITCMVVFAACDNAPDPSGDGTTTPVETTTVEPVETEAPAELITIVSDGSSEYKVIRPERTSQTVISAASDLRIAMSDAIGKQITIGDDWVKNPEEIPEAAKEIVVGECDRPETAAILKTLRRRDFALVYSNERVYILGGSDEATARGVEYFIANHIDTANKKVTVMSDLNYVDSYEYALGAVSINGVSIMEYKIVIPKDADVLTKYAAQNLSDYLFYEGGYLMETVTDAEAASDYELLVGATNRPESSKATSVSLKEDQYVLAQTGSKVVMYADNYMVGGAVSDFINNYATSATTNKSVDITNLPSEFAASTFKFEKAESALLLICDGMGFTHIEATLSLGKLDEFAASQLPNQGEAKTSSYSVLYKGKAYTDSAAAATALATGYKTMNNYVGLDYKGSSVQNVRELAYSVGARTAVITTDLITGATPAGFLAHVKDRDLTDQIQKQIDQLVSEGKVNYVVSKKDDETIINDIPEPLWGIAENGSRYFCMIEEAYTDKRSHKNNIGDTTDRVKLYNEIVAYCIEYTLCHPKSVLIVTADHETGGIEKQADGTYKYTTASGDDDSTHTNRNVPVFAMGDGTEMFNNTTVENVDIAKFIAKIYGATSFGQ
ncbi:MAG: alkaline phosphatase [Clostridia bacterium]|nr:alkaline phosphatase [Clostridia bacterium]